MKSRPKFFRAYSFLIITLILFLISWGGQWIFQLNEVRQEAQMHGAPFQWADFWVSFFQSTFENWQSEFLQLCWQALGLALLLSWGSSQSREGEERVEAKIDALLKERGIDPEQIDQQIVNQFDGRS